MAATIVAGNFENNSQATQAQTPESLAVDVLSEYGARDIERAKGAWRDGKWDDFDPLSAPQLVSRGKRRAA